VPTYEYECESCRKTFEARQRITAAPLTTCQLCGSGPVRRLLSAARFILKGGGWYVTDYPSESRKKGLESEKKPAEPAASTPAGSPTPASSPAPAGSSSGNGAGSTPAKD
jgi:putative FmdB family regulatory protein